MVARLNVPNPTSSLGGDKAVSSIQILIEKIPEPATVKKRVGGLKPILNDQRSEMAMTTSHIFGDGCRMGSAAVSVDTKLSSAGTFASICVMDGVRRTARMG